MSWGWWNSVSDSTERCRADPMTWNRGIGDFGITVHRNGRKDIGRFDAKEQSFDNMINLQYFYKTVQLAVSKKIYSRKQAEKCPMPSMSSPMLSFSIKRDRGQQSPLISGESARELGVGGPMAGLYSIGCGLLGGKGYAQSSASRLSGGFNPLPTAARR